MRIPDKIAEAIGKLKKQKMTKRDAPISGPVKFYADRRLAYSPDTRTLQFMFSEANHYVHQDHVNMCGEAACAMLCRFAGESVTLPRDNPRGPFDGAEWADMSRQYPNIRWHERLGATRAAPWTPETLMAQLLAGGPLVVAGNFVKLPAAGWAGHYVLIKGIQGDDVYLYDPWHGPNVSHKLTFINQNLDWQFGGIKHRTFENGLFQTAVR